MIVVMVAVMMAMAASIDCADGRGDGGGDGRGDVDDGGDGDDGDVLISAPGKVILHGEHSVVYGKVGVVCSVALRTFVRARLGAPGDRVELMLPDLGCNASWDVSSLPRGHCSDVDASPTAPGPEELEEWRRLVKVGVAMDKVGGAMDKVGGAGGARGEVGVAMDKVGGAGVGGAMDKVGVAMDKVGGAGVGGAGGGVGGARGEVGGAEGEVGGAEGEVGGAMDKVGVAMDKVGVAMDKVGGAEGGVGGAGETAVLVFLYLWTRLARGAPVRVLVVSDLPPGSGLGSSAAYSTSLSTALLTLTRRLTTTGSGYCVSRFSACDLSVVNSWAMEAERIVHGTPSGIDNAISTYGGALRFESGKITPLPRLATLRVVVTNTLVPRCTKKLVAAVRTRVEK
ncbi:mevalonate kinase, partial [Lampetra fluviatilis]